MSSKPNPDHRPKRTNTPTSQGNSSTRSPGDRRNNTGPKKRRPKPGGGYYYGEEEDDD